MLLDNVVFLDLETTGGSPLYDRIIEIGLVEIRDGRLISEWSTVVNPGRRVPAGIQTLTGITDDMIAAAPTFAEVAPALAARLAGKTLAAHNARFDYTFLRHEFTRAGIPYRAPVLCTVKLSRRLYPHHERHNLDVLLVRHGIFCLDRHRALGDAQVLWQLAQAWRRDFAEAHLDALCAELTRPLQVPPALPPDLLDDIPEAPGAYVFYGENDLPLYVGRSANLHARVSAHFANAGRAGKDAAIARDVRRLEWIQTTGELGAALRESALVSKLSPVHNRTRAQAGELYTWRWRREPVEQPELVSAANVTEDMLDELYGVFRTRAGALQALRGAVTTNDPRPIARAIQLAAALSPMRVRPWPFDGAIGVREYDSAMGRSEVHVLHRWCYLGTARSDSDLGELLEAPLTRVFSLENYKVLTRFLKSPPARCRIFRLERARAFAA